MTQLGIQMAQQQDGGGSLGAPNVAQAIEQITTALIFQTRTLRRIYRLERGRPVPGTSPDGT
jgi:hypothetical protein